MFYLQANSQHSLVHLLLTKDASPLCRVEGPWIPQENPHKSADPTRTFYLPYFTPFNPHISLFPDLVVEDTDRSSDPRVH